MDRRTFLKTTGAGLAGLGLAAPYVARAAAPLTLRWAHFSQEDHPANIAAKQFASRIEARTDGAIKVNIFANNVLGGPAMDWLSPLAEKQGFVLLRNWDYGFRNVTNSVRPIHAPDDVKGLKLRTPPELQIQASMEALGAIVQAIAFPELYLALSQKVVDGEENQIPVIYFNKFYEVQKHLAITRHIYNNMIHTVGANTWKKLTPDQQAMFREESAAAGDLMRKLINDGETEQIKKLEAAGMQVTRPDLAPFRAKMEPAYKRVADYAGEANVKKFRDLVEHGRKTG